MHDSLAILLSWVLLVVVLWGVRRLGLRFGLGAEWQRKLVHTGLGLYALSFPWLFTEISAVVLLCLGASALLLLGRLLHTPWGSALHQVQRRSWGELYFTLAIALLYALSQGQTVLYILPLLILTLSDASAALVGTYYGRQHFGVRTGQKSLEGSLIFCLTAWLLAQSTLLLLTPLPPLELIMAAGLLACLGTLLEAASWRGLDNLFIPIGLFLLTEQLLLRSPSALLLPTLLFLSLLGLLTAMYRLQQRNPHPLITLLLAAFFIWLVGGINVIAPLGVLALGYYLGKNRLNIVIYVISIALGWFSIERLIGYETRLLYHLHFGLYGLWLLWPRLRKHLQAND